MEVTATIKVSAICSSWSRLSRALGVWRPRVATSPLVSTIPKRKMRTKAPRSPRPAITRFFSVEVTTRLCWRRQLLLRAPSTMRLTYQSNGPTGFLSLPGSVDLSEEAGHWVIVYKTSEQGVCQGSNSVFYVGMHVGKHQVSRVYKEGNRISFVLKSDQRAVDIKISMSYVSREGASRNIDVESPGWNDFEVEKDKARKAWNYYLSKVAIDEFQDGDHDKTDEWDKWSIFYSALYRPLLHMNTASDVDGNYKGIEGGRKNLSESSYLWVFRERYRYGGSSSQGVLLQLFGLGRVPFTDGSGWFACPGLEPGYGHQLVGEWVCERH